jgi:hypothetical protein
MSKIKHFAVGAAVLISSINSVAAQRFQDVNPCQDLVSGACQSQWEESGYYSFNDCVATNIGNCEAQQESGGGVYDVKLLPGPRCVSRSGIQLC